MLYLLDRVIAWLYYSRKYASENGTGFQKFWYRDDDKLAYHVIPYVILAPVFLVIDALVYKLTHNSYYNLFLIFTFGFFIFIIFYLKNKNAINKISEKYPVHIDEKNKYSLMNFIDLWTIFWILVLIVFF